MTASLAMARRPLGEQGALPPTLGTGDLRDTGITGRSEKRMANRLATATSPYLRQHAANPVDWREWGPEAFADAERRDVPILLSVGYAACHWCHEVDA